MQFERLVEICGQCFDASETPPAPIYPLTGHKCNPKDQPAPQPASPAPTPIPEAPKSEEPVWDLPDDLDVPDGLDLPLPDTSDTSIEKSECRNMWDYFGCLPTGPGWEKRANMAFRALSAAEREQILSALNVVADTLEAGAAVIVGQAPACLPGLVVSHGHSAAVAGRMRRPVDIIFGHANIMPNKEGRQEPALQELGVRKTPAARVPRFGRNLRRSILDRTESNAIQGRQAGACPTITPLSRQLQPFQNRRMSSFES